MTNYNFDVEHPIIIPSGRIQLDGLLHVPSVAKGIVLFVHGSGSSRLSIRNQFVARTLNEAGFATLLFDLLTPEEEKQDDITRELRFDILFLTSRLIAATNWIENLPFTQQLSKGYFGASTGAAAAIVAAAEKSDSIKAIVSRGGRPDLAGEALSQIKAPTLLIVGGNDDVVIDLNQEALQKISAIKKLEIVPGATHLFEEPGTLDEVARLAQQWFKKYL